MTTEVQETAATEHGHEEDHISHPTPAQYWLIALVLAIITGVEIAVPSISAFDGAPRVALLFILGGIKFGMVVALFMHLKFDKPLYRNFFLIGLVGAIAMFIVVLLTFQAI
jgi:heme/copper-type cytochrome/quinol oxidase subunit 4